MFRQSRLVHSLRLVQRVQLIRLKSWPPRRLGLVLAAAALAGALAGGGAVLAQSDDTQNAAVEPAAPVPASGGAIDQVRLVTENVQAVLTPPVANTFANVPGAATTMPIPPNTTRLIIAQFTAESACYGGPAGSSPWCSVRILIGGAEGNPVAGVDFAFDSSDSLDEGVPSWESHTVTRSLRVRNTTTAPINVSIVVQWANTTTTTSLRLDDWHLTVFRAV
jgi:hypothetical protein